VTWAQYRKKERVKLKAVRESVILFGDYRSEFELHCEELGMLMAASLESGII
jgi:hypothetical protein